MENNIKKGYYKSTNTAKQLSAFVSQPSIITKPQTNSQA